MNEIENENYDDNNNNEREAEAEALRAEDETNGGQQLRRSTRVNAGKGVERTHPFVQFAMREMRNVKKPKMQMCIIRS